MGGARSEPPSQVWERIAETLKKQGITTVSPESAANVRRSRRLRTGWAAVAAAAALLAAVLILNQQHTDNDKVLVTDNLPEPSDNTSVPIVTPDNRADMIASSEGVGASEKAAAGETPVIDDEYYWNHPSPVPPVNPEFVRVADKNEAGTVPNTPPDTESETLPVERTVGQESGIRPETRPASEPVEKPLRQWADRSEIERMLAADKKERRAGGMSMGLYSSNIGSRSTEKVVQSTPYAKTTSSFVAQETVNAAYSSLTRTAESTVLQHRIPLSVGINVTKGLGGRFSLESGVTYSYLYSKGESSISGNANRIKEQHLHYVGIPVGVKYDMFRSRYVDLYASAFGLFEMCVFSKQSWEVAVNGVSGGSESKSLNVRGIQPSLGMRVGAEAKLSRTFGIYFEPGFSYYFDIQKQPESYRTENPFNFAFSAGLRIKFK